MTIDRAELSSIESSYLCERKGIYEQDLAFIRQEIGNTTILPSDQETIGLFINMENFEQDKTKSLYRYIESHLEKQTGLAVVDYKIHADLATKKHIEEGCTSNACFAEYSWLIDTNRLLVLDLDKWGDRLLISFSVFHPETQSKESIHEKEFNGLDIYDSLKQSIADVSEYFKTQRAGIYCEVCPEI